MLDISLVSGSTMSATSKVCFTAAGLLLCRKVFWVTSYQMGGFLANLMGKENVAEWNKTSRDYWTKAKKDAFQDLTATAVLITMGLISGSVGSALLQEEQKKEEANDIQSYAIPLLKGLYNHKGKITALGLLAGIGYQYNQGISPEQKRIVHEFVQTIKKPIEENTERAMQFVFGNKFPSSTSPTESSPWSPESMANKWFGSVPKDYGSSTKPSRWSPESMADKFFERPKNKLDKVAYDFFSS